MAKRMDIFLGERDQIEVTVYEHGQVLLYNKFTDALIQSDVAQIARVAEFVRESHTRRIADIGLFSWEKIEVTVYEHGQVLLYNKFADARIQSDVAQIARVAEFARESHAHLAQEKERKSE